MHKRVQTRRTATSFLLTFAVLFISVATLLPTIGSSNSDGDFSYDIRHFSFQTLSNATQNSSSTDLRFCFTIGSLYYDEVGFVFSTSNPSPTVENSDRWSAGTVYSSISSTPAPAGRWWVAVKLSSIPHEDFETVIYVRPYIKNNGAYSYGDAKGITVCEALTIDRTVAGENAVFNSASPSGAYYENGDFTVSKTIGEIRGNDHFFPTARDPTWKCLYFEYSILWNPTLANTADPRISIASFDDCELFGFYTRDDAANGKYGGRFDFKKTFVYAKTAGSVYYGPKGELQEPITSASVPAIGEYGWHRIGVVFDMSLVFDPAKQDKRDADPHGVLYYAISELYIDGVCVWEIRNSIQGYWHSSSHSWKGTGSALRPNRAIPFMAIRSDRSLTGEFGPGGAYGTLYNGVWYVELDSVPVNMYIEDVADADDPFFVAVSDVHWSCGGGFVRQVSPVSDPTPRTVNLGGENYPGTIWYVFDN